jgi:hypothetical protein
MPEESELARVGESEHIGSTVHAGFRRLHRFTLIVNGGDAGHASAESARSLTF